MSAGVYRLKKPQVYIDVNDISDLRRVDKTTDSLILGGNVTLSMMKHIFNQFCSDPSFHHLRQMASHVDMLASVSVRNVSMDAINQPCM